MKKVFMTLTLLLTTIVMSAQVASVKIAPKYQKGDNMLYRSVGTMTLGGEIINLSSQTRYYVADANADGYVIETTLEKMDTDAKDLTGKIMQLMQGALKGVKTVYTTDADGKITGIKNFNDAKDLTGKIIFHYYLIHFDFLFYWSKIYCVNQIEYQLNRVIEGW